MLLVLSDLHDRLRCCQENLQGRPIGRGYARGKPNRENNLKNLKFCSTLTEHNANFAQLTRLIARLVKTRRFDVDEKVLRTFLSLRIKEVHKKEDDVTESRRVKKERLKIMSRREKKVWKVSVKTNVAAVVQSCVCSENQAAGRFGEGAGGGGSHNRHETKNANCATLRTSNPTFIPDLWFMPALTLFFRIRKR